MRWATAAAFVVGLALGGALGGMAGIAMAPDGAVEGARPPTSAGDATTAESAAPGAARPKAQVKRAAADPLSIELGAIEPAVGTGVFRGTVRDATGRGIEGVVVTATPEEEDVEETESDDAATLTPEERLRRDIRDMIETYRRTDARRRETRTDAAGAYAIDRLAAGSYYVSAEHELWDFRAAGASDAIRPDAVRDFRGTRRHFAAFELVLPDGTTAEHGRVLVTSSGGNDWNWQDWSRESPRIRLRPGQYDVRAYAGANQEYACDDVPLRVDPSGDAPLTRLVLHDRAGILGRLLEAEGEAPRQVRIVAVRCTGAEPGDAELATSDELGTWLEPGERFSFLDIDPGKYVLAMVLRGRRVLFRETVTVGETLVRRELKLPAGDLRDYVLVRVLAPDGTPVDDVNFEAGLEDAEIRGSGSGGWSRALGDGRFRVPHWDPHAPEGGGWGSREDGAGVQGERRWVVAHSSDYGTVRADYQAADPAEVVLRFPPPARLTVTVRDAADATARNRCRVALVGTVPEPHGEQPSEYRGQPDSRGVVLLGPLPPGVYELVVRAEIDGDQYDVASSKITLSPGDNEAAVTCPKLFPLTIVRETPSENGLDVRIIDLDDSPGRWIYSRGGDAAFHADSLPPGRYQVRDGEEGEMIVTLPPGGEVRFRPKPYNALRFSVDSDSDQYRAGLRDGDLGVAVDGTPFRDAKHIRESLVRLRAKGGRLTVLRDGRQVEVPFEAEKVLELFSFDFECR